MPTSKTELGLSSLERVELLGALEDRYQVDLSETKFASAATVGDLERLLQGETRRAARVSLSALDAALAGNVGASGGAVSCWCVQRCFCWDGRAWTAEKTCAAFAGRCW